MLSTESPTVEASGPHHSDPTPNTPAARKTPRRAKSTRTRSGPANSAWAAIMAAVADEPAVHEQLKRIEALAGATPPQFWLAGAVDFLLKFELGEQQLAFSAVMCKAAGQECKLDF